MNKCIKCGSYAFNLYKDDIDQGGLCDVHYWQDRAHRAEALAKQEQQVVGLQCAHCQVTIDTLNDKVMSLLAKQEQGEPVANDAIDWGDRLNKSAWAAVEAWDKDLMGPMSGAIFNNIKGVVRAAILEYLNGYPQPAQPNAEQEQGEPDKYIMDIECTKCGAKESGVLTFNMHPQPKAEQDRPINCGTGFCSCTRCGHTIFSELKEKDTCWKPL